MFLFFFFFFLGHNVCHFRSCSYPRLSKHVDSAIIDTDTMLLRAAACNCKSQGILWRWLFLQQRSCLPSDTSHVGQNTDCGVQISAALSALFASLALCCAHAVGAHGQGPWSEAGLQTPPHLQVELGYRLFHRYSSFRGVLGTKISCPCKESPVCLCQIVLLFSLLSSSVHSLNSEHRHGPYCCNCSASSLCCSKFSFQMMVCIG